MTFCAHHIRVLGLSRRQCAKKPLPLQPGDVPDASADFAELVQDAGHRPDVSVEEGARRFVDRYHGYYRV